MKWLSVHEAIHRAKVLSGTRVTIEGVYVLDVDEIARLAPVETAAYGESIFLGGHEFAGLMFPALGKLYGGQLLQVGRARFTGVLGDSHDDRFLIAMADLSEVATQDCVSKKETVIDPRTARWALTVSPEEDMRHIVGDLQGEASSDRADAQRVRRSRSIFGRLLSTLLSGSGK